MTMDFPTLESRYLDVCKRQEVLPNPTVLSGLVKARLKNSHGELCSLQIVLDYLSDVDFPALLDVFSAIDSSEIDKVDILHESRHALNGEYILSLMRAVNQKLRVVDLNDSSFGRDCLLDLFQGGLTCQVLNLRSSHIRKLNINGSFMHLHTLNLDFSISLSCFQKDCFTCMPNLTCLSMCETRVSNLWTTTAALSKLPSLVELRFQNCLCCSDTAPCPASSSDEASYLGSDKFESVLDMYSCHEISSDSRGEHSRHSRGDEAIRNSTFVDNFVMRGAPLESTSEDSSDDSEVDFLSHQRLIGMEELFSNVLPELSGWMEIENEISSGILFNEEEGRALDNIFNVRRIRSTPDIVPKKYVSHHPSPICFETHYREYMIASLPRLKVLDNLPIKKADREMAKLIFSQHFEYLPYRRQCKDSVVSILRNREMGAATGHLQKSSKLMHGHTSRNSPSFFPRSLCASKVGSLAWPLLNPVSNLCNTPSEEKKNFRPRQFEYHPSDPSLMVFGTLDGEIVVTNHENGKLVGYVPSVGTVNSVLGLCWLRTHPSKLIAGSDNGSLQLYNIHQMASMVTERYRSSDIVTFDDFEQLTSVHVNSTDEHFIASGYSRNVALYDIGTGKRLQVFTNMHRGHINVVKFAHHSPSIFATSSFDQDVKMWDLRQQPLRPCYTTSSSRGNVMVCFSPDDHYLLLSAVDNEVTQLLAADGRVHTKFDIASTGSSHNYTRSYYMNGRDYIISGSCDEHIVRICCAQTGRRFRDISLEGKGPGSSMFVQSLRGDPFRDFHMSILAAYLRPSSKSEIIKVNLMASSDSTGECSYRQSPSRGMGG